MTYDRPMTLARGYDVPDPNGQPARHNEKTDNNDTKKSERKKAFSMAKNGISFSMRYTQVGEKKKFKAHISK